MISRYAIGSGDISWRRGSTGFGQRRCSGSGLSPAAKVLDLKGRFRCRGCGRKGRAVVSIKWRERTADRAPRPLDFSGN
jgi:hypothetical protein